MLDPDYPWWHEAVCAQIGPQMFFLPEGDNGNQAKAVCAACPVRLECLAEAIVQPPAYGIFGGFGRAIREQLARQVTDRRTPVDIAAVAIKREELARGRRTTHLDRAA